jgi:hypothetical protein
MAEAKAARQAGHERRQTRLSPELAEFLHMLKSLESEFQEQQPR